MQSRRFIPVEVAHAPAPASSAQRTAFGLVLPKLGLSSAPHSPFCDRLPRSQSRMVIGVRVGPGSGGGVDVRGDRVKQHGDVDVGLGDIATERGLIALRPLPNTS